MTEAEKLYNETFARWASGWSVIYNFRNTFHEVAPAAAKHLAERTSLLFQKLFEDPQWGEYLIDGPQKRAKRIDAEKLAKSSSEELFKSTYDSLNAAVLVFCHSVLDAQAIDYCRVIALHAPADWDEDLKNTQITLLDAQHKSFDELRRAKLDKHLEKLEKESLPIKLDRLFAKCQPPAAWLQMVADEHEYTFDRDTIKRFDEQRHQIIHGKAMGKPLDLFQLSDDGLQYLFQTGKFLYELVRQKFGLQIVHKYVSDFLQAK